MPRSKSTKSAPNCIRTSRARSTARVEREHMFRFIDSKMLAKRLRRTETDETVGRSTWISGWRRMSDLLRRGTAD